MLSRNVLRSVMAPVSRSAAAAAGSRAVHLPSRDAKDSRWGKTADDFERVQKVFKQHRACAVLRTPTAEAAPKAMQASVDGGFKIVEFTLTTPGCLDAVANFRAKHGSNVMVGCGTIMDIEDAQNALDAGSEFIVAPVLVPEVVTWCRERNIVCIPGCTTPSELYKAYKAGAPIQKLFPGVAGGANFVKAVSAALPMLRINPTSGVELDNAHEFLNGGACSVGLVAPLFNPEDIASGNWDSITAKAKMVCDNVAKCGPYKG